MGLFAALHRKLNPEIFQGPGQSSNYFEGWYFKVVNASQNRAFAFIPGIALDKNGQGHAFIQVLDGIQETARYHRFDLADFEADSRVFKLQLANNFFSEQTLSLQLPDLQGELSFDQNIPWPKPWYSPGIMGPFSFVPFMQCYHGIVSMDHCISGYLDYKGERLNFEGGRGYLEKDWGRSFPSAYIWMQTNHFSSQGISLKVSVANIPWLGSSFVGFIAGLWLKDQLIQFTTYNGTRLKHCYADTKKVEIILQNRRHLLKLSALRSGSTELASPIQGAMQGKIEESMTAEIKVELWDRKRHHLIWQDVGKSAGLEVAGAIETILKYTN